MADEQKQKDYKFTEGKTLASFIRQNTETQTEIRVVEVAMEAHGITKHFVKIGQRSIDADNKPGWEKSAQFEADLFEGILAKLKGVEYTAPAKPARAKPDPAKKAETQAKLDAHESRQDSISWGAPDPAQAAKRTKRTAVDQRQLDRLVERATPEPTPKPKAPKKGASAPASGATPAKATKGTPKTAKANSKPQGKATGKSGTKSTKGRAS
jgi:hypothetical protein